MKVFNIRVENKTMQFGLKIIANDINQIISYTPPCINIEDKESGIKMLIPMDQITSLLIDEVIE